jgi:hypothetical protein
MRVIKLAALHTGRLHFLGDIPVTHFFYRQSRSLGHRSAGRIKSMRNPNDSSNGNRTCAVYSSSLLSIRITKRHGLSTLPCLCPVLYRKYVTKHSPTFGNKDTFVMRRISKTTSIKCMSSNPIKLSLYSPSKPL